MNKLEISIVKSDNEKHGSNIQEIEANCQYSINKIDEIKSHMMNNIKAF